MDYCSSCRRALNWAVVCPGCGAYAPDIAPPAAYSGEAPPTLLRSRWDGWQSPPHTGPYEGPGHQETALTATTATGTAGILRVGAATATDTAAYGYPYGYEDATAEMPQASDAEPPGSAEYAAAATATRGGGRSERRRQLTRWKRKKRRAAVVSAVALVGGGLTLAVLPGNRPAGHPQTAAGPEPVAGTQTDGFRPSPAQSSVDALTQPGTGKHRRTTSTPAKQDTVAGTGVSTSRQNALPDAGAVSPPSAEPVTTAATNANSPKRTRVSKGKSTSSPSPDTSSPHSPRSGSTPGGSSPTSDTSPPGATSPSSSSPGLCLLAVCLG